MENIQPVFVLGSCVNEGCYLKHLKMMRPLMSTKENDILSLVQRGYDMKVIIWKEDWNGRRTKQDSKKPQKNTENEEANL